VQPSDPNATFTELEDGSPAAAAPAPDRFRVERELARGGLGRVLRGHDTHLDRVVAIKTLLRTSPSARARFERETRLTARLQHPNIVPVYDGGVDADGQPFLAMRLVGGVTLTQEIERAGTLAGRLRLLPQVIAACNAVAYAHHQRVTHRDLKPDNILVGDFGETLVIDWGLAKDLDALDEPTDPGDGASGVSGASGASLTRVGAVVGTPAYMPPEQAAGQPVDVRADVYALGAVLYHLLAGHPPYAQATDAVAAVLAGPPTAVDALAPGAPRDLVAVVNKAMARDPADRYADAQALAAEVEQFQAGRLVGAHHYTLAERAARLVRQNPATSLLAALLVVVGAGAFAALAEAYRVAELRRSEAEVARAEAETLQRSERDRLDTATVEQARLVVDHDPIRSLALLATLSPGVRFGGEVRTIAAAALAAGPPRSLPGPPGGVVVGVGWAGQVPVVGWDTEIRAYPPEGPATVTPVSGLIDLVAMPGRIGFCAGDTVSVVTLDTGARLDAPLGVPCSAMVSSGGDVVAVTLQGRQVSIDPAGRVHAQAEVSSSTFLVVSASADGGLLLADQADGSVILRSGERSQRLTLGRATYGLVASPSLPLGLRLGADPPLTRLSWEGGTFRAAPLPVDVDWLQHAAFVTPSTAVVGGGGELVLVVDLERDTVRRLVVPDRLRSLGAAGGGRVLVGTESGELYVLDPVTGDRRSMAGADEPIVQLVTAPDASAVLAATPRHVAWHALPDDRWVVHRSAGRIDEFAWTPAGALLVVGLGGVDEVSPDGSVTHRSDLPGRSAAWCGGHLWLGGQDGSVSRLGEPPIVHLPGKVHPIVCSGDERRVAFVAEGAIGVLDTASGAVVSDVRRPNVGAVMFAPDGTLLLGRDLGQVGDDDEEATLAVSSAHGSWTGSFGGAVWQLAPTRRLLGTMSGMVSALAPVGEGVMAGDEEGGLTLWRGRGEPEPLVGHRQYVSVIAVHPGGRFVATAGWDDTVWLWDLDAVPAAGRPLRGHPDAVTALTWSADGTRLYSGDRSGGVRVWTDPLPLEPSALRAEIERWAASP
jgi:hypothetical protein